MIAATGQPLSLGFESQKAQQERTRRSFAMLPMLDTARFLHRNVSVNISVSSLLVYKPKVVEDSQK